MAGAAPAAAARTLTAAEVAALAGGPLAGDATVEVTGIAPLASARASDVSFCGDARHAAQLERTEAGVLLVTAAFAAQAARARAHVVVPDAMAAALPLIRHFRPARPRVPGIHPTAVIGRGATIGADVTIGPYVVIEPGAVIGDRAWLESHVVVGAASRVGEDCRLHAHVTLYHDVVLGARVEVHSGTRIGSDGYGFRFDGTQHVKVPQTGGVVVGDDVEFGANCTVDRGTLDDTVIGSGTKLDNLVHVGHNCRVGRLCLLMAFVGLAGSTVLEDGVAMAGQSGAAGQLTIGAGARIAAQAGVIGNVPRGETWTGFPARPHREFLRGMAAMQRLSPLVKALEKLVAPRKEEA